MGQSRVFGERFAGALTRDEEPLRAGARLELLAWKGPRWSEVPDEVQSLRSVEGYFRHEVDKIKGSRFIATLDRCADAKAFASLLDKVRAEFPDANHHCFAWRGESAKAQRCSDDREPYGSAGIPMLKALEGRELFCTGVVVTRYFGGTKLGVGGLVRAYGGSAAQALDLAPKVERPIVDRFELRFEYGFQGVVESQKVAFGAELVDANFGEDVTLRVEVPSAAAKSFCESLVNACSGSITIKALSEA